MAHNFRGDWQMLWKEISAGFLIAGFIALLPMSFFNDLFVTDASEPVRLIENVIVGPIVAVLSFVCSVGNVPLAAVLWAGGISFSGVMAFIYADLIVIPIVLIYRKFYGWTVTWRMVAIMFVTIVLAALAVDGIFSGAGLVPTKRPSIDSITNRGIDWNYTTALNIVAFIVFGLLWGLTLRRGDPWRSLFDSTDHRRGRLIRRNTAQQECRQSLLSPAPVLLVFRVADHRGVDPAEVGDAGTRPERGQLDSQRAAERLDAGLGGRVGTVQEAVDERVDGGDDDDMPAPLHDLRQCRADGSPDAEHVDLEDALPFLAGHPVYGAHLALGDAGVGDDDVEAAEALDRLGDRASHRRLVGDVGADPDRPLADSLGRVARLTGVEVDDRDRGAAQLHLARGLVPDPARGSGHEGDLPVEVEARHQLARSALIGRAAYPLLESSR